MSYSTINYIDKEINKYVDTLSSHSLYDPIKYILSLDGKRVRPKLFLDAIHVFKGETQSFLPLALAIEVFHNFTLIHDDIMDNSSLRRGKKTVHEKWDNNTAILSGDAAMILSYQLINQIPHKFQPKVLALFNQMSLLVCEGQQDDMLFEKKELISIDEYINMIKNKTSVLLAFCLEAAAIVSHVDTSTTHLIKDFGINLGIAFQLQDDYLDLYPRSKEMGKEIGGDIKNKKKALPLLIALENDKIKNEVISLIHNQSRNTVSEIIHLFNDNGIPNKCQTLINDYYFKAKQNLSDIEGYDTRIFFDFCMALENRVK